MNTQSFEMLLAACTEKKLSQITYPANEIQCWIN